MFHSRIVVLVVMLIVIIILLYLMRLKVYATLYQTKRRKLAPSVEENIESFYISADTHQVYYNKSRGLSDRIHCWYLNRYPEAPVIYYLHGNNTDLHSCRFMLGISELLEYNLFMIDYRGFGRSSDIDIDQTSLYEDVEAGYSFLQQHYSDDQVIVWGTSLGCNMALHLAVHHLVKANILLSPYSSLHRLFDNLKPPQSIMLGALKLLTGQLNNETSNLKYIRKVKSPTILIHSRDDQLIPSDHSRILFEKLPKNIDKALVYIRGNHDAPVFTPGDFKKLLKFIGSPNRDLERIEKILELIHGTDLAA